MLLIKLKLACIFVFACYTYLLLVQQLKKIKIKKQNEIQQEKIFAYTFVQQTF